MKTGSIFFRSRQNSTALKYTLDEILGRRLGLSYLIVCNDEPIPEGGYCIHYGIPGGNLNFPDSGILWQRFPASAQLRPGIKQYWLLSPEGNTEGDLFGSVFYLLSRLEEQTKTVVPDQHGRYPDSLHFREVSFRDVPLVECWTDELRHQLSLMGLRCLKPTAEVTFSIDWDNPTAFKQKGIMRNSASFLKDMLNGDARAIKKRMEVLSGRAPDPYDNLGNRIPESALLQKRIFFWTGNYGPFDKGLSFNNSWYRNRIKQLARMMIPGLHPSYAAFQRPEQLMKEKQRLENILDASVTSSRFHFLRFRLPESYRMLEECGIREDFSMGFSAFPGFRAGTALPFRWFDLQKNQVGNLLIHPFSLMDSSAAFRSQGNYSFLEAAQTQLNTGATYGFPLHTVFHNEHPAWSGWEDTIQQYLKLQAKNTA